MRTIITLLLLSSSQAFAAGYSCLSVDGDTKAVVHFAEKPANVGMLTSPEAKQVVFIDPTLSKKSQILAVLENDAVKTTPSGDGVVYDATIAPQIKNPGKNLGGTRVGLLATITVAVQTTSENARVHSLDEQVLYSAQVTYAKKDGEVLAQDFDCALFLGDQAPELNP